MDNLTIGPVNNLHPRDNDINPSELVRGRSAAPHLVIDMEGTHDLVRSPTASTQDTIVPIQDTISSLSLPSSFEVNHYGEGDYPYANAAGQVGQVCELKLHQQIGVDDQQADGGDLKTEIGDQRQDGCILRVKMEIRFRHDVSPKATQRVFSMHYFELYKCSNIKAQGLPTHVHKMHAHNTYAHKPYVWSIDVQHPENPNDPVRSPKICRYSISGDGTRVATLSATDDSLFLDLWDISVPKDPVPHRSKKLTEKPLKRPGSRTHTDPHASIAVSWNASYIAVFPTAKESWVKRLAFYDDKLKLASDSQSRKDLPEFIGEAKFHITNTNNPKPSNELFITCKGDSVDVYKACGQWSHIFSFPVQLSESIYFDCLTKKQLKKTMEDFARELIDSLQGNFFLSFSNTGLGFRPLIWDIENHSLVVAMTKSENSVEYPMSATFSNDQSILAILQDGSITTYWRGSKTAIGKWTVPHDLQVSRLMFVRNDTQLLVECTDSTKQERVGYILDPITTRMTLLDKNPIGKVLGPGEYMPEVHQRGGDCNQENNIRPQRLYSCRNSKLDYIQLDNIAYDPDSLNTRECDQQMCNDSCPIPITNGTFKSESGLEFSYKFNPSEIIREFKISKDTDTPSSDSGDTPILYKLSTLSLQISDGSQEKLFKVPTITHTAASKDPIVLFLRQKMLLILCPNIIITVWRLPEKYNDECTLLTTHWIGDEGSSDIIAASVDIKQCEYHQHLFIRDPGHVKHYIRVSLRGSFYDSHEHGFRLTVEGLVMMYTVADKECRKSIVQYLTENINRHQIPGGCVILWIFNKLSDPKYHKFRKELLGSVLSSKNSPWIPRPDFEWRDQRQPSRDQFQPSCKSICRTVRSSKRFREYEGFKSIEDFKPITQYCIEIAQKREDIRLTSPITACLPIIWRHQHREAAIELRRKLAYIPMNDGTQFNRVQAINMRSILDDYTWEVRKYLSIFEGAWGEAFENEWSGWDDVFHLVRLILCTLILVLVYILTPLGFFTFLASRESVKPELISKFQHPAVIDYLNLSGKKYYSARFDMLWKSRDLSSSKCITGHVDVDKMRHSWLLAPLFVIRHSIMPSHRKIECHELNLDAFDNPAIEALIEYKWNAFGFYFWLIRFLLQCIYYILVLTVVFVQVYKGQDWIVPLYDAVTVFSATFLWFEFIQFIEQPWKYITSPYNLFDLFVFVFPMIGCITAKRGGDIAALSFSVIFVFLHF
ncbi:hypothetical protein BGZ79_000864, partial [Entomortierella chlamydospora]